MKRGSLPPRRRETSSPGSSRIKALREPKALALSLVRLGSFAVVFGTKTEAKAHLILARSEAMRLDLRPLVAELAPLFNGKGGGGASLVEIAGDKDADLEALVARAMSALKSML